MGESHLVFTSDEANELASSEDEPRSIRARNERMVIIPKTDADNTCVGKYEVTSQSQNTYVVQLKSGECDCPDHKYNKKLCKHVRRTAIEVSFGDLPAPGTDATEYLEEVLPGIHREIAERRSELYEELETLITLGEAAKR